MNKIIDLTNGYINRLTGLLHKDNVLCGTALCSDCKSIYIFENLHHSIDIFNCP
ncbi:MAG: hypothetical protein ACN4EF_00230 [Wenyingzhuangia sp.]